MLSIKLLKHHKNHYHWSLFALAFVSSEKYFEKFEKQAVFWLLFDTHYSQNVCKHRANDWNFKEKSFFKFYRVSSNHNGSTFLLVILCQGSFLGIFVNFEVKFFQRQRHPKIYCHFTVWQFSRGFHKSNWFCWGYLEKYKTCTLFR